MILFNWEIEHFKYIFVHCPQLIQAYITLSDSMAHTTNDKKEYTESLLDSAYFSFSSSQLKNLKSANVNLGTWPHTKFTSVIWILLRSLGQHFVCSMKHLNPLCIKMTKKTNLTNSKS